MTTIRIIPPNSVDSDSKHYAHVREAMLQLGAPTVRAWWDECTASWLAIEGSHRIAVAAELGIEPEIIDLGKDIEAQAAALRGEITSGELDLGSHNDDDDDDLVWFWGDRSGRQIIEIDA